MRTAIRHSALGLLLALPSVYAQPLTVQDAVRLAASKAENGEVASKLAQAQLDLLESMGRRRFEFRPQVSLLAFSNPALLAASLGSGFLFGRTAAPPPYTLQASRYDLLLATAARERARLGAEIQAVELSFDLLQQQHRAEDACSAWRQIEKRGAEIAGLVRRGSLTALDALRNEQEALDREAECTEAQTQRELASQRLARAAGLSSFRIALAEPEIEGLPADAGLPGPERLTELALSYRKTLESTRESFEKLRSARLPKRGAGSALLSAVYENVNQHGNSGGLGSYFPGHSLRPGISWTFSPRNPEAAAQDRLLDAKARALETELAGIEQELHSRFEMLSTLAAQRAAALGLARRRQALAERGYQLIARRVQYNLGPRTALFEAETARTSARTAAARAAAGFRATILFTAILCGIHEEPPAARAALLAGRRDAWSGAP